MLLEPLPDFNIKKLKGVWLYEGANPFPAKIHAEEATPHLPIVINKEKEIIIRDKTTGKVVLVVLRNRIGADALGFMRETIIEMVQVRRKIARSQGVSKLNQGTMAAAGYACCFFRIYILVFQLLT